MERTDHPPTQHTPRTFHLVEVRDPLDGFIDGYTTTNAAEARIVYTAAMGRTIGDWEIIGRDDHEYRIAHIPGDKPTIYVFGAVQFPTTHVYGLLLLVARALDAWPKRRPFEQLPRLNAMARVTDDPAARVLLRTITPDLIPGETAAAYAARLRQIAEEL